VTSDTFIGRIYGIFGLRNIADGAKGAGSGYPQLSAEHIIESDPDLIFLADTKCCGMTSAKVAARPGWGGLSAVTAGHVYELDDDVASRWGPRIVELVRTVARAVEQLEGARA
jgi:iron complex transport system substrate-binding protein